MKATVRVLPVSIAAVLVLAAVLSARPQGQAPAQTFRAGTTIVPVDVRVVDKQNRPVTDLTAADFTITENGVRQEIAVFATQTMTPQAAPAPGPLRRRDGSVDPIAPQSYRVFLLLLGRGRLNGVKNSLDGLEHFVRDDLHPQDYVAVQAYNRATDFTTDHAAIIQLLKRYRRLNYKIEADLQMSESGLQAVYGKREVWPKTQAAIDEVFGDPKALGVRRVVPPADRVFKRASTKEWEAIDAIQEAERSGSALDRAIAQARTGNLSPLGVPLLSGDRPVPGSLDLDVYVSNALRAMQDGGSLYAGVEALRNLDGEKHLVFLTSLGSLFEYEMARQFARAASDARIAIDVIHTNGMVGYYPGVDSSLQLANITGGRFDVNRNRWAARDLDLIDQDTNFKYVIGYRPTKPESDGKFRDIKVQVNRKDLKVMNRRGYYATDNSSAIALRDMTAFGRVAAAAHFQKELPDLAMSVRATAAGARREITFNLAIDLSRLTFERSPEGRNTTTLDVAFFCLDSKQRTIGEMWKTVSFDFSDARLIEIQGAGGAQVEVSVPITGVADTAKVVAYEYAGDIVGSRNVSFPKPAKN